MRWWPRSLRWQMLLGLALLEAFSIVLFASLLTHLQHRNIHDRVVRRLSRQADALTMQVQESLRSGHPDRATVAIRDLEQMPSVSRVLMTDSAGRVVQSSETHADASLDTVELGQIRNIHDNQAHVFALDRSGWESVKAISNGGSPVGYLWIESEPSWDKEELGGTFRATALFALIWVIASVLLVWVLARNISRPLAVLHRGTRELVSLPESSGSFPLPVMVENEIGDLILAFNRMVAAIEEQRAGLHDTLSLLDSMLANAPVGFAFFDRYSRFVRVNHVFADLTGLPLSRLLGRTPVEILTPEVAAQFDEALRQVFSTEEPVNDSEFRGDAGNGPWTWLVSAYPVRTTPSRVRWAGIIIRDVSERVRSEETLRKTEKLAATGRLAASIAHEINNPLEGLTNLLYLLRKFSGLSGPALEYVEMAEHQTKRIAEIAQKTLRFYRQATLPVRARVGDLMDSILDLYQGRMHTLNIHLERDCDPEMTLFCYEGEIRQVLANLIGNAIDATTSGGRLVVRARASRSWANGQSPGVRFTIADTGTGMTPEVRSRMFEAFFTTKDATGTGLGLWVSQEIIEKHRGVVHVRSRAGTEAQNSGTVFQLFIPDDESLPTRIRAS